MPVYEVEDLDSVSGDVAFILKNRAMFGPPANVELGAYLASHLASQLAFLRSLPFVVEKADAWWIIASRRDWLVSSEGASLAASAFSSLLPLPESGPNSHRSEVLLSAFADAVVTAGDDGLQWIKGSAERTPLPGGIDVSGRDGRMVAFRVASPSAQRNSP